MKTLRKLLLRFYYNECIVSKRWGGLFPTLHASSVVGLLFSSLIFVPLTFVLTVNIWLIFTISASLGLILIYILLPINIPYAEIQKKQKIITNHERILYFIIKISILLLFYKTTLYSLNN